MATTRNPDEQQKYTAFNRALMTFAYQGYARIATRKHGVQAPEINSEWTDEVLAEHLEVVRELAHLPPA